jgi:membrane associated rhomboid family serine protease
MLFERPYMRGSGRRGNSFRPSAYDEGSVIKPLIIANAVFFILTLGGSGELMGFLWLSSYDIRQFEFWRLATYMFAHGGFWHILMNMWGLFLFGRLVEQALGARRFLQLYFTSGIIGGLIWLLANWGSSVPVVGASGAVFGVMMAAAMMYPNHMIMLLFPPIPMRLKTFVLVFALIEVFSQLGHRGTGVAHLAHLGGLLGAFVYMRWLLNHHRSRRNSQAGFLDWLSGFTRNLVSKSRRARFESRAGRDQDEDDGDVPSAAEVDRILDKIGTQGLSSLTQSERRTLERAREYLKDRRRD